MRKLFLIASICLAGAPALAQPEGCSLMSITKLHADHPLTKAGLIHRRTVRRLEVGAEPGDVVFQFQHGRIIHTSHDNKHAGYGMFNDGAVPEINRLEVHKEFLRAQAEDRNSCGGKK